MIRVTHFSDWHSGTRPLPEADVYICTGDMLDNTSPPGWHIAWPDKLKEEPYQKLWVAKNKARLSALFPSGAVILCVRGNHDFIDLAPLFRDVKDGTVHEFVDPRTIEIQGIRFGGFRGVPPISGNWADEETERVLAAKCEALGPVDVLVTHGPARGILDFCPGGNVGSVSLRTYVLEHKPRYHLFGHIHESAGQRITPDTTFSNAAQGVERLTINA